MFQDGDSEMDVQHSNLCPAFDAASLRWKWRRSSGEGNPGKDEAGHQGVDGTLKQEVKKEVKQEVRSYPTSTALQRELDDNRSLLDELTCIEAELRESVRLDVERRQEDEFLRQQENKQLRTHLSYLRLSQRASLSMAPINIFKNGADEEKAETARMSSFIGAIAIGDLVKSTLGPKGMDKILLSWLVNMSKVQDDEVGDGTTSVTVLAAELLREAELLIAKKIHPQTIIAGWRKATNDAQLSRRTLLNIARTTLSSKLLTHHKAHFSQLAVDAVMRLKGSGDLEAIHIIKKLGGSLTDSYLDEGFLLDKKIGVNQPKRMENIFGSRVRVDSTAKVAEIEMAEKEKMKEKLFAQAGVMAIEHADFAGVERLALVTGGEITSTFDHPELVKLGPLQADRGGDDRRGHTHTLLWSRHG
ncbi:hypothetical protein KUCAC02_035898 [Chaenocephalus aceratus]|nr:hypothetical protein KUCAC02_035898 [Chaenocephalus aceratus]